MVTITLLFLLFLLLFIIITITTTLIIQNWRVYLNICLMNQLSDWHFAGRGGLKCSLALPFRRLIES